MAFSQVNFSSDPICIAGADPGFLYWDSYLQRYFVRFDSFFVAVFMVFNQKNGTFPGKF